jgi:hypothetical protein
VRCEGLESAGALPFYRRSSVLSAVKKPPVPFCGLCAFLRLKYATAKSGSAGRIALPYRLWRHKFLSTPKSRGSNVHPYYYSSCEPLTSFSISLREIICATLRIFFAHGFYAVIFITICSSAPKQDQHLPQKTQNRSWSGRPIHGL